MSKYYEICQDDFEALPFCSDMDEGWSGHTMIIEENFKDEFISEQVARFTRHLLSILHELPIREKHNPFCRIAEKYPRIHSKFFGDSIECPKCGAQIGEEEWNTYTYDMRPVCPVCEFEFEMEEE